VKAVTLYNWAKHATPLKPAAAAGSVEELKARLAEVRKENRELILPSASQLGDLTSYHAVSCN